MTEQFPPGYRDPNWKGDTHPEIHDHEIENDLQKGGAIIPFFSDKVLELADSLFAKLITAIEESPEAKALTEPERAALYISLADAFSDTTDD